MTNTPEQGFILWLMGPTSSGKTTIAELLLARLRADRVPVIHYDGDEVRDFFGDTLGFAAADRLRVVGTLVHLANKSLHAGVNVIVSALTANDDARTYVRENAQKLLIGYVACSIEECAKRDPKGLYAQANGGEINTLIGFNSEYVAPDSSDMVLDTENYSPENSVAKIVQYLQSQRRLVYTKSGNKIA